MKRSLHKPESDYTCPRCKWVVQAGILHECDPTFCPDCDGTGRKKDAYCRRCGSTGKLDLKPRK